MAMVHGLATAILLGIYNISGYCDSADTDATMDTAETTTFGSTAKTYIAGLRDGKVSLQGKADYATGAIDDVLSGAMAGSQQVFSLAIGGLTIGNRAQLAILREQSYKQSVPVGDVVNWSGDLQADGGLDLNGVVLAGAQSFTGTANMTSVDGSAATTNGYAVNLHVTAAVSLTGAVFKVQHSSDNASWSDLCTFTTATGTTSEQKTGTGTVNRYVRVICSSFTGTSCVASVCFARR